MRLAAAKHRLERRVAALKEALRDACRSKAPSIKGNGKPSPKTPRRREVMKTALGILRPCTDNIVSAFAGLLRGTALPAAVREG